MVNLRLPWLQVPGCFGFICVKTMANFRKGTWVRVRLGLTDARAPFDRCWRPPGAPQVENP